jgi:hypothetical protein
MTPTSSPTSKSSVCTITPGFSGFFEGLGVVTGRQLRQAIGNGWPISQRGNATEVDLRMSEELERPMARIFFPPIVDENARDVS